MTDMTAFERQVAGEMVGRAGPVRPVDDLAVFESVAATSRTQGWGFTMFSALKFITASVIVALFGGFLLAGLLTTEQGDELAPAAVTESPSPATTDELLSGMVTEEVEPGVFRVSDDGVRDLRLADPSTIVAGDDGSIWLLEEDRFYRLGTNGSHAWPTSSGLENHVLEVASDGTMRVVPRVRRGTRSNRGPRLHSEDGEEWSDVSCQEAGWPSRALDCSGVALASDGSGRADASSGFDRLFPTDSGDLYAVECGWICQLYGHEDGSWRHIHDFYEAVDVGPDGTIWGTEPGRWDDGLARYAEGEWTRWTHEELPEMAWGDGMGLGIGLRAGFENEFRVAPDGSLWTSLWVDDTDGPAGSARVLDWEQRFAAVEEGSAACDGVVRFDGERVDQFLPGACISMDIAADGFAWVLARLPEDLHRDLYVITPEAVADTE